jgi:hypothetical protein
MKTKLSNTVILLASTLLTLSACGGGGGEDTPTQTTPITPPSTAPTAYTVSGKVIDGYVVGATVYLDLNGNAALNTNEPSAVTTSGGDYLLTLNDEQKKCQPYVAMVVDVPVGAVDEDLGTVESAYQMVMPPQFGDTYTTAVITPLTTALWEVYREQFIVQNDAIADPAQACANVIANLDRIDDFKRNMAQTIKDIVSNYNIPEATLFSDFIANGDTKTQGLAMLIVSGLKKSLSESIELRKTNPNSYVMVNYLKDGGVWVRKQALFSQKGVVTNGWTTHSGVSSTTTSVSDDLEQLGSEISSYSRTSIAKTVDGNKAEIGTVSETCDNMEQLYFFQGNQESRVTNVTNTCGGQDAKYIFNINWTNITERTGDMMQIILFKDQDTGLYSSLNSVKDFNLNKEGLDFYGFSSEVGSFTYTYDSTLDAEEMSTLFANISFRKYRSEGGKYVEYYKNLNSNVLGWDYETTRTNPDGTYTKECKAAGSSTWLTC